MDQKELDNRFKFHPATEQSTQNRHQSIREACLETANVVDELVPEGREKSLAITKLEEAMMWANAGIARAD